MRERNFYLVQRLERSWGESASGPFNATGLSPEGDKILGKLFSLDYMGSAEFEFGAIPKCFHRLAKDYRNKLRFGSVQVTVSRPRYSWDDKLELESLPETQTVTVYLISPRNKFAKLEKWVQKTIGGEYARLKEPTRFGDAAFFYVCASAETDEEKQKSLYSAVKTVGWLEIEFDCFYFIDEEMYEAVKNLLNVKKPFYSKIFAK